MDIDDILHSVSAPSIPQQTQDLHALTRSWVAERSAPEILPWDTELMNRVMDGIRRQIEFVEAETGNEDPKTNFKLIIVQTELERWKWLVRSYVRARIAKVDKYALYFLSTPDLLARLAPSEIQYARAHQQLLQSHNLSSFLQGFPERLRGFDDTAGGISMVEKPDEDNVVWVRVLKDGVNDVEGSEGALDRGGIYVCRWSAVRERVLAGDVEII